MAKARSTKSSPKVETTFVRGLSLLITSVVLFLSLLSFSFGHDTHNWLGLVGFAIGWICHFILGLGSYIMCFILGWIGWRLLFNKSINHPYLKGTCFSLLIVSVCMLLSLIEDRSPSFGHLLTRLFYGDLKIKLHLGGAPLYFMYHDMPGFNLIRLVNTIGVALIFTTTLFVSLFFLFKITPMSILRSMYAFFSTIKTEAKEAHQSPQEVFHIPPPPQPEDVDDTRYVKVRIPAPPTPTTDSSGNQQEMMAIQPETNLKVRPSVSRKVEQHDFIQDSPPPPPAPAPTPPPAPKSPARKREAALAAQRVHNGDFAGYAVPSPSLLSNAKKIDQSSLKKDLKKQAEVLEETLQSFGIEAKVGQINCGPTITSFEVHPAIGVKVQKIKTLENDIALNMEAKSIRIIAPIPGKAAVGIEVPNPQPQEVGFKDMLLAYQQSGRKFHIPILLGKAVNGDYVMSDLTKMPHCIIAGATGSGKSVCINTIVMSILLTAKPDEIKLIMVDPKKVELTPYTRLPHMLAPVITEPLGACAAMNWLVKEMESRYELFKQLGVRNIEAFNTRTINKELESSLNKEIPVKLPYIVGIIDELADLMMVSSNDIETPIARIAQMARAVGIHLILATQRPSREVITGLIKANFPTRISFKVASRVNSQIVLDETGAEMLLGNGDMLFLPPGTSHLTRAQGAFIRDEDINAVVKVICDQAPPNYVIESFDAMGHIEGEASAKERLDEPTDELYDDALDIILSTGNASTTFLQRKLKIGYARAASLVDQLEAKGVVGPADGAKPRKILVSRKEEEASDF